MNPENANAPLARSWRDIPQPVKPRAMSAGGRWRRVRRGVRLAALAALAIGLGWGVWFGVGALSAAPKHLPAVAQTVPVRHLDLKTPAGGVLDGAWLARTLALPRDATLLELDLERLRDRLLAEGQVASASLARQFPDRLIVRLTERVPVARVRVEFSGQPRDLLVAPDGFVFQGAGFDPAMLASLPWLSGLALIPEGAGFRPIPGMGRVAQLFADAQFSAQHLYQTWMSVSLARLAIDRQLEVTTKQGTTILFNATGDFFVQLATLDYLLEQVANTSAVRARIDLTVGRNVPVMLELPPPAGAAGDPPATAPAPSPSHPLFTLPARPAINPT